MKVPVKITGLGIALCLTISCQTGNSRSGTSEDLLKDYPVVGQYVTVGEDPVFVLNPELLKDTIELPLSYFVDDFEIVKLDNADEALISETGITISDNYMVAHSGYPPQAYKLFDRKGNYISSLGAIGQGPGEYKNVYDVQIDEPGNRVYLLPWMSANILVYDLKGEYIASVPLKNPVPKGKFSVDTQKETLSVVSLPFTGLPCVAWTQDLNGNVIDTIATGHLTVPYDFSNEVSTSRNIPGVFDVMISCISPTRSDTLYQYDVTRNRLKPVFTYDYKDKNDIPWHSYNEWPEHFTGNTSGPPVIQQMEYGTASTPGETIFYIVDKKTGKGAWFKLYNDYLADEPIGWPNYVFNNGYYVINNEPGNLIPRIEAALKNLKLSETRKQELAQLLQTIDDNDNNYLLIAKLKN